MMTSSTEFFQCHFEPILLGLTGAEGPVFDLKGEFFMVAAERGEVHQVDISKKQSKVVCKPVISEVTGIPAGLQVDKENNVWIADMRHGLLKLEQGTGKYIQVVRQDSDGSVMQGCNDCIFDYKGRLWITAPAGDIAPAEFRRSDKEPFGCVYLYSQGVMRRVDTGFLFSNGIAVAQGAGGRPDTLLVAETGRQKIWCYNITDDGVDINSKKTWAQLPEATGMSGGPDGMDFDAEGNLLVANYGAGTIDVFNGTSLSPHTRVRCPFLRVTNLHFQPESRQVYVTENDRHGLWTFTWKCEWAADYCRK